MKRGEGVIRVAWFLLGLLAIATIAFALNKPTAKEEPYATSFDPGGSAALAELLRQEGYKVSIAPLLPLTPDKSSLQLAFIETDKLALPLPDYTKRKRPRAGDEPRSFMPEMEDAPVSVQYLVTQLKAGGEAVVFEYDPAHQISEATTKETSIVDASKKSYKTRTQFGNDISASEFADADATFSAWQFSDESQQVESGNSTAGFAKLEAVGSGEAAVIGDGEIAMNAYIDQGDNARLVLDVVKRLVPASRKITILDGAVSNSQASGLLDVLGPWAQGIEMQLLVVGFIIVYTLGKRFGIADETPKVQPGARELMDGIADTFQRGKAAKGALQLLLKNADRSVRRHLKLASDAPARKRNDLLPPSLAQTIAACEHALVVDLAPEQAYELARRLETEVDHFIGRRQVAAKSRLRRVKSA